MGKCNADTAKKEGYITQLGRNWNNGSNTSPFYWNVNNVSSNRNRNISAHPVNAKKNVVVTLALPLGKTEQSITRVSKFENLFSKVERLGNCIHQR